jgi:hypothetical protein
VATRVLNGKDYVARQTLTGKPGRFYPEAGVVAMPGDTCERVDPKSLPWLLEQGLIAPVDDATKAKRGRS